MMNLFDYQQKALDLIVNAFKEKATALVVMATGLGKTIVSAFWAQKEINNGHKGLFLCHNNGILDQAMLEFRKVLGEQVILKPFYGSSKDFNADQANVVFASFQTYRNWKHVFFEDEFGFIIVDESHHGQASTFKDVICYFKPKKLLGITATPDRMDLKDIREFFGKEIVNYSLEEAIAKGWLTQVEYHILNDRLSHWKLKKILKGILRKGRRIYIKQLNETIFIKRRDDEIARQIQQYAGTDKKAVIFCEGIEHVETFKSFFPNALTYHSGIQEKESRRRLSVFREDSQQYILAVNKFNEGIDIPDVEVIVFLRCTDSRTIFYQQLGRGLRKVLGKSKVVVLDFVANCERLAMVKEMAGRVKEFAGNHFVLDKEVLHVSGKAFDFIFSDDQVDILNVIKRINEPFYKTWQEAGEATRKLGISSVTEYRWGKKYKQDYKLPACPNEIYKDFPGWKVFLGTKEVYTTWQEAGEAARKLGISSLEEYARKRKQDSKLPGRPYTYKDFPGFAAFLGTKRVFYATWQEAGETTRKLGISSKSEYLKKYKKDRMLCHHPEDLYKDFPGFAVFLRGERGLYGTWQEASEIAKKLGILTQSEYFQKYKRDRRLRRQPNRQYKDFPGWKIFLGTDFYRTWQEASEIAKKLKALNSREYVKRYKQDCKLPSAPDRTYKDFPGWKKFLGKEK
ncbi:MAG: DEAD/DEAH box helicase family protein [Candidatus Paceibacterota bacterium]|jgi:superfamily II DNA or RNA helicase